MLILASGSPRRKQLLEEAGISFIIKTADVDEQNNIKDPKELVEYNAVLKAGHVARENPESWVLGSDTTVVLGNEILNKPVDLDDALGMLMRMSARTHNVYTGVCLTHIGRQAEAVITVVSGVTFKPLNEDLINEYFKRVNPLDKAGAYGIQEGKEMIIESFEGSFSNIMGLPVDETIELLRRYGL